jgi:uncharacterized protein with FMN-binding domain
MKKPEWFEIADSDDKISRPNNKSRKSFSFKIPLPLAIFFGTVLSLGSVLMYTPPNLNNDIVFPDPFTGLPSETTSIDPLTGKVIDENNIDPTSGKQINKPIIDPKTGKPTTIEIAPTNSGVFKGSAVDVGYGIVQVQITLLEGKITDVKAIRSPSGKSQRYTDRAIPKLITETLAIQSGNVQGVSGASYTSAGFKTSLQYAISQARMTTSSSSNNIIDPVTGSTAPTGSTAGSTTGPVTDIVPCLTCPGGAPAKDDDDDNDDDYEGEYRKNNDDDEGYDD